MGTLGGANEIGALHRRSKQFCSPLPVEQREQVIAHLKAHGSVVIGDTLLALDFDNTFKTGQNPTGAFIVGARNEILAAAETADQKGIAEALRWAETQPVELG